MVKKRSRPGFLGFGKLVKRYRRYRYRNQYDSPIIIMFFNTLFGMTKLLLLVLCAWAVWFAATQLINGLRVLGTI